MREFIANNRRFWPAATAAAGRGRVLVEGLLAGAGPNYLVRTGLIARAVAAELSLEPAVVFSETSLYWQSAIELYRSFGIDNFINERSCAPSVSERLQEAREASRAFRGLKSPDDLLSLSYKGVRYGDLAYDTIIHDAPGTPTIDNLSLREFFYVLQAHDLINTYDALLGRHDVRFYVATHSQYLTWGLLVRCCLARGIPVVETTDLQLWLYEPADGRSPKFHDCLRRRLQLLMAQSNPEEAIGEADRLLAARFAGAVDQSDVKLAYAAKRTYDESELRTALAIDNDWPIAFIFAHIFSDAPQGLSDGMLFRDYYSWLDQTLRAVAAIPGVNWVVKPHPANTIYKEEGLVDRIVEQRGRGLFVCPADFSPASVPGIARAIVTAQGTAGLEFGCFGVPAILAGRPFYAGFGFTIEPRSVEEYVATLRRVPESSGLSRAQQVTAKQVFAAFMRLQQADTTVIDADILHAVWGGNGVPGSPERAYELLSAKLGGADLRESQLYLRTRELMRDFRRESRHAAVTSGA